MGKLTSLDQLAHIRGMHTRVAISFGVSTLSAGFVVSGAIYRSFHLMAYCAATATKAELLLCPQMKAKLLSRR